MIVDRGAEEKGGEGGKDGESGKNQHNKLICDMEFRSSLELKSN
jgi:hypothetical protein